MPAPRARRDSRRLNKLGETWEQTVKRVHAQYPSTAQGRDWWYEQLESRKLLGSLLYGILNEDAITEAGGQGRRGSRPPLDLRQALLRFRQLRGDDYTVLPFREAFAELAEGRSVRALAARIGGMSYRQVHRMLTGEIVPDGAEMEQIATAFGKRPTYFKEYRTAVVCALAARAMDLEPERSQAIVAKLTAVMT